MKAEGDEEVFDSGDSSDAIVDRMFDGTPTDEEQEIEDDKNGETEEEEESEETEEEESTDTEESEESEEEEESEESEEEEEADVDPEDYDEPVTGKKKKEAEKKESEEDLKDESTAQKRAKENGRQLKEERAAHQTSKLEIQRQAERITALEKDLADTKRVKTRPMDDPEYQKLHSAVMTDVRESAELIDGVRDIPGQFGNLVSKYLKARKSENRDQDIADLRTEIIQKCVISDVPFEDMDDSEKAEANKAATKVMTLLRNNSDRVQQALDLAEKLTNDAEDGSYVLREREYGAAKGELDAILEGLGTLGDDLIEAHPHAVESIVAGLIRDNPQAKGRSTKLKADLVEVFVGPRPLTKAEITKLKAEGTDVAEFERERVKAHHAKRVRLINYCFQGIMTRSLIPSMAKELSELKGEKKSEEDEVDTLINRTLKKGPAKKLAKKKPAKVGTSARDALYGHNEYADEDD